MLQPVIPCSSKKCRRDGSIRPGKKVMVSLSTQGTDRNLNVIAEFLLILCGGGRVCPVLGIKNIPRSNGQTGSLSRIQKILDMLIVILIGVSHRTGDRASWQHIPTCMSIPVLKFFSPSGILQTFKVCIEKIGNRGYNEKGQPLKHRGSPFRGCK